MSLLNQEVPKQPDFSKPVFKIFPTAADDIKAGLCPMCQAPLTPFRDAISEKEFSISGMCQTCQDAIFGFEEQEFDSMEDPLGCNFEDTELELADKCSTCVCNDSGELCDTCLDGKNYAERSPV